jgi:hypothetical protein
MDAAIFQGSPVMLSHQSMPNLSGRMVNAREFRELLVSHRRLVRADQRGRRLKGLQDLDTGEVFLTDERRLLEAGR